MRLEAGVISNVSIVLLVLLVLSYEFDPDRDGDADICTQVLKLSEDT